MARTSENSRHDLEPLIAAVDGLAGLAAFKLPEKLRVPDVAFELLDIGLAAIEHALFVVRDVAAFRRGLVHDGADGVGLGRPRFFKRRKSCHFGLPFEVERGDLPAPRRARLAGFLGPGRAARSSGGEGGKVLDGRSSGGDGKDEAMSLASMARKACSYFSQSAR